MAIHLKQSFPFQEFPTMRAWYHLPSNRGFLPRTTRLPRKNDTSSHLTAHVHNRLTIMFEVAQGDGHSPFIL